MNYPFTWIVASSKPKGVVKLTIVLRIFTSEQFKLIVLTNRKLLGSVWAVLHRYTTIQKKSFWPQNLWQHLKGSVSDFWDMLLISEITKTNMPLTKRITPLSWYPHHQINMLCNPGNSHLMSGHAPYWWSATSVFCCSLLSSIHF